MSVVRRSGPLAVVALLVASARMAAAQPAEVDKSYAEQLFQQAKGEMNAGHVAEACATLEAVWNIDHGGGTLLALAMCHEKQGRSVRAMEEFRAARELAVRSARDERARLADEHLAQLERSVARIVLITPRAREPGLRIELDGEAVDSGHWDTPLPIDPGEHRVTATVPGHGAWGSTVHAGADGERLQIELPPWPPPAEAPPSRDSARPVAGRATSQGGGGAGLAGYVVGGVGLAAIGVGAAFGLAALDKRNDALAQCHGSTRCTSPSTFAAANSLDAQSSTDGLISSIVTAIGVGALTTGVVLVVLRPRSSHKEEAFHVGVTPTLHGADAWLRADF